VIRVQCPHCERRYRTVTEAMGKPAVCSKCKQTFRIGESRPAFQWKQTDLAEDSWIGVQPPEEREELRHCFMCDAPMQPGDVRCPDCGANQITGVVHRSRFNAATEAKPSFGAWIPFRWILMAAAVAVIGAGAYWVIQSAAQIGDELADQSLVQQAAKYLRESGDEYDFPTEFGGRVSDEDLSRFLKMLSANDPNVRRAVILLIGHGRVRNLEPIVTQAESQGATGHALEVLQVVGPRRLVKLSGDASLSVRQPAALALCILFELERGEQTLGRLTEPCPAAEKILTLNELCRPRPQAVGPFHVVVNGIRSPFLVEVEQVGRAFYLHVGSSEFRTPSLRHRTFEIPIERWCAATGSAVDVAALRRMIAGVIVLQTPLGVGWHGTAHLTAKQALSDELPGFLPVKPPKTGETVEVKITLEPPQR